MKGIYPLWEMDTHKLIHEFIDAGFKTLLTCVDSTQLDAAFVGRTIDEAFLSNLPQTVDQCGENGEFHTFVYDGPMFRQPVPVIADGTWIQDDRFCYCDLK